MERGRDPFYDWEGGDDEFARGGGMRGWMTPLSLLGNHGSVIVFDAKRNRVGILDQESGRSRDYGVDDEFEESEEEGGNDDEEDENGDDENGKEEEDKPLAKGQRYDEMRSRPAADVLRDIARWYKELIEIPGDGEQSCLEWGKEVTEPLYRKHGWPSANFDGEAFLIDKARVLAAISAQDDAEEPVREVQSLQGWLNSEDRVKFWKDKEEAATTEDEKWSAKWEVWRMEQVSVYTQNELEKALEVRDRKCPGGICQKPEEIPLYELRALREECRYKKANLESVRQEMKDMEGSPREKSLKFDMKIRHAEKQVLIWEKAVEASERDAERLCPGMTLPARVVPDKTPEVEMQEGIAGQESHIEGLTQECQSFREWLAQVPVGAMEVRQRLQAEIDGKEEWIEGLQEGVVRSRDILASMRAEGSFQL